MKRQLVFRPEAEQELRDAYQWYERKHRGLGEHFMVCMEEGKAYKPRCAKTWR